MHVLAVGYNKDGLFLVLCKTISRRGTNTYQNEYYVRANKNSTCSIVVHLKQPPFPTRTISFNSLKNHMFAECASFATIQLPPATNPIKFKLPFRSYSFPYTPYPRSLCCAPPFQPPSNLGNRLDFDICCTRHPIKTNFTIRAIHASD